MHESIARIVGRIKGDRGATSRPRVPRPRFLPQYRNNGMLPERKRAGGTEWQLVANRADRRSGRAGKVRKVGGYAPRTSPRMRHGIDDQPRASVVERRVRRAAAAAVDAGHPAPSADQLTALTRAAYAGGRSAVSYRGRGA